MSDKLINVGFFNSLWNEFKKFAIQGNMVDLAVGVVIGAAFGTVVTSLVKDIIMPPIGYITGGVDFNDKQIEFKAAVMSPDGKITLHPAVDWRYGAFITNIISFLIVAASIFLVVKLLTLLHPKHDAAAPPPPPTLDQQLLTEIRDLLKDRP